MEPVRVPAPIVTLANATGLFGWSLVLLVLLSQSTTLLRRHSDPFFAVTPAGRLPLLDQLCLLELICVTEVGRIALGQLRGNLVLGAVLHAIRLTCLVLVLPDGLAGPRREFLSLLVLYSWSLTEVGRYPMYLFPQSPIARRVRLVLPLFTFPAGAAAEALGAYGALARLLRRGAPDGGSASHWAAATLLGLVVFVNAGLGPTLAYPALLKKGLPALMGTAEVRNPKRMRVVMKKD